MITLNLKPLTDSEKEEIKNARKILKDKIKWTYLSNGRVVVARGDVWVEDIESLSFHEQYPMELNVRIVIPSDKYDFWYRTKSRHQVIRMYHNKPGHDEIEGKIPNKHKHWFENDRRKRAYAVDDIGDSPIRALKDFCTEEKIEFGDRIVPLRLNSRITEWEGRI
jgi:hypothetical protein